VIRSVYGVGGLDVDVEKATAAWLGKRNPALIAIFSAYDKA
jgi:hypothetical protein